MRLAEQTTMTADRPDVAVLPTLSIGVSEHHRQFHGTPWTGVETFESLLPEVHL